MAAAAIERSKSLDTTVERKYSIWRWDFDHPHSDSFRKLMQDQMIMAKVCASNAMCLRIKVSFTVLLGYTSKQVKVLHPRYCCFLFAVLVTRHTCSLLVSCSFFHCSYSSALDQAKAMGHILSIAKDKLYECDIVAWTLEPWFSWRECDCTEEKDCSLDSASC